MTAGQRAMATAMLYPNPEKGGRGKRSIEANSFTGMRGMTPDLASMDDTIANGTLQLVPGVPGPLALFRAARIDYSLHRLYHYTGTDPEHFQNFVIFTNYQFYVEAFARLCEERMGSGQPDFEAFVAPGDVITRSARRGGGKTGIAPERM